MSDSKPVVPRLAIGLSVFASGATTLAAFLAGGVDAGIFCGVTTCLGTCVGYLVSKKMLEEGLIRKGNCSRPR